MKDYLVRSSKGQVKVQQMAFVLVAIVLFFTLAGLFLLTIQLSSLKNTAEDIRDQGALERVKKIAGLSELAWTVESCKNCIDLDKTLVLKERRSYEEFWDFSFLRIERVYPSGQGECTRANYPDCGMITIIEKDEIPNAKGAFVSLCRYEGVENYYKCELGKILLAEEDLK